MGVTSMASSGLGSLVGAIGGLVLSAFGMYKQEEESERARQAYGEETIESRRRFGAEIGLQRSQLALQRQQLLQQKEEADRTWKWKNEDREWGRTQQFVNNFQSAIAGNPEFSNRLLSIWRR